LTNGSFYTKYEKKRRHSEMKTDIKQLDQIMINTYVKEDSIDVPDCFGDFNKKTKLCSRYCSISIRCCILQNKSPKIDILEKLLIHNQYAIKLN